MLSDPGFLRQEIFDLDSSLVLIYGPNGTGKSSFCEALEYGLLGNVAEAESKRFRPEDYLKNAHVEQFVTPAIEAISRDSIVFPVLANESQYRFCFVEKNRIDNFSRIAAQLPARQTELISTLFGLDGFNEFVRNFTSEIDERYIDLYGRKSLELTQKQQALVGSHQVVKDNTEALVAIAQRETSLATQFREGIDFYQLIALLGNAEAPGEIAALDAELQHPVAAQSGVTLAGLEAQQKSIEINQRNLDEKERALIAASEGLSFKQLYEAVVALGVVTQDECPACKTPISQVSSNPFELAPQELAKLSHLSRLQEERNYIFTELSNAIKQVYRILKIATERFASNPLQACLIQQDINISLDWWSGLFDVGADGFTFWAHLQAQAQQLEKMDADIEAAQQLRAKKQERLIYLRDLERQVTILQTQRKSMEDGIKAANQAIANFDEVNKDLIQAVELEKSIIKINKEIASNYFRFVQRLEQYRDSLPRRLIADLGDTVRELYNAFNRNDSPKDLLAAIELPLAQGQRIRIAFQDNPEKYHDALHVMSEGHIRCIGLAILMAKNIRENCPIMIFDDPVNAIDDDHRESIRRTLFEDGIFDDKQVILTCHGEEFYKDIQNLLGAERSSQSRNLTFLPQHDERHICVDFNCAPRNYILAAQGHIDRLEVREALTKARQALESLSKGKVWRYVNRHGDGNLSIKMRSPHAPIELRNLTEQLKSKIAQAEFVHQEKDAVLNPLDTLLGINGNSREWRYLNKGTHEEEDRAEFDRPTVAIIVASLVEIDAAI
ncbi:AAA family ATPase [Pseudomonadota bacterium]